MLMNKSCEKSAGLWETGVSSLETIHPISHSGLEMLWSIPHRAQGHGGGYMYGLPPLPKYRHGHKHKDMVFIPYELEKQTDGIAMVTSISNVLTNT